jgi:hypothetical protein
MFVSLVQFDEILHVHRNAATRTTPKHTVFSFMSNFEYTPYVSVPGFPRLSPGMRVAAVLREQGNWKTLVGWRDLDTGLLVLPDGRFHLYRLLFLAAWLLVSGYSMLIGEKEPAVAFAALVFAVFGTFAVLELRDLRRASADAAALRALLSNAA